VEGTSSDVDCGVRQVTLANLSGHVRATTYKSLCIRATT
jgi:hypothetical protein